MDFEALGMIIFLLVFLSVNAEERRHEIKTPDSGLIDSKYTPDVYTYYTKLSSYTIYPTKTRSITFKVKACHDAHMLLSSARNLISENFYEVLFGKYLNSQIILRRKQTFFNTKRRKTCSSCLSCVGFKTFTVKWLSDGTIIVMKDSTIYIRWKDPDPIVVNGIGIMTGWGVTGLWIFETEIPNEYRGKTMKEKMCPCSCNYKRNSEFWTKQNLKNYSRSDLEKILEPELEKIKQKLQLNKYNLSSYKRKRSSAYDNRKSSKQIGIVGIMVLIFVIGVIVAIDISAFRGGAYHLRRVRPQKPRQEH